MALRDHLSSFQTRFHNGVMVRSRELMLHGGDDVVAVPRDVGPTESGVDREACRPVWTSMRVGRDGELSCMSAYLLM